jgi:hypothetical protein
MDFVFAPRVVSFTLICRCQVIRGWDEGVMKMSLGESSRLKITADYGQDCDICLIFLQVLPVIFLSQF